MKFVLANWGTRGEVEPFAAIGRELVHRGHDVHMVVAPEMVSFAESAGPAAVGYGPTLQSIDDPHHEYWKLFFKQPWRLKELNGLLSELAEMLSRYRSDVREKLISAAAGADVLLTGMNYEDVAANVAEYCRTPLATLQIFPLRANGRLVPLLPGPLGRAVMAAFEWWEAHEKKPEIDAERRELGLPEVSSRWPRRVAELEAMEIQAYDSVCYPGLAEEWAAWNSQPIPQRPFVGALTMQLAAQDDEEIAAWIAGGKPPIFFSFGSMPVDSAADTLAMIARACASLGERALIGAGWTDFSHVPHYDHVKVVGAMNYAKVFPACRAVVHHGGSGTTHAGLRAGRPTLILWMLPDQACWGGRVKDLKVGTSRRFSATTEESLVSDLRKVLSPQCAIAAQELAARMTKPAESVAAAADLLENFAHSRGR
ncbi:glycosyltransferase [Mycobacterium sp. M26]|uniref:glycosyltransferase n=1 Tax=Mycobacterium sp. M26 TaxID=1762962 RepID=UPI00073E412E|nr:glycosyltransferase [Mycobacterium sp. M26]